MSLVEMMSRELGVSHKSIQDIANRASHMYKIYSIPKRTGGGQRPIAHPALELKVIQRWLAVRIFSQLPVHACVFSYKVGVGIRQHAEVHRTRNYLLRIDIKDFFPSILNTDVVSLLAKHRDRIAPPLSRRDMLLAANLACRNSALTIGAPSSPVLSNAVLFEFDDEWSRRANQLAVSYTRYADDLYFSTDVPNVLETVSREVRASLNALAWPRLRVNDSKTTFTSRKRRRVVTGVRLTSDRELSLGRDNKRYVRSLFHKFLTGVATDAELSFLKGYLAFAKSVEPDFAVSLVRKFGTQAVATIERVPHVSRKG